MAYIEQFPGLVYGQSISPGLYLRFLRYISPEPNSGCWLWTGSEDRHGYGTFSIRNYPRPAHRIAYLLFVGNIPRELQLDHLCRNSYCVNPAHLEPVTQQENIKRGNAGRKDRIKTHCAQGHPFAGDNVRTIKRPNGRTGRVCRTCMRMWGKQRDKRRKERGI